MYNGYRVFSGVKSYRCVTLSPHPLLVPWSWKGRALPPFPLWAVRPVQSLNACTRVHFTFYLLPTLYTVFKIISFRTLFNVIFLVFPYFCCKFVKLFSRFFKVNFVLWVTERIDVCYFFVTWILAINFPLFLIKNSIVTISIFGSLAGDAANLEAASSS